jgi:hypothetical protein
MVNITVNGLNGEEITVRIDPETGACVTETSKGAKEPSQATPVMELLDLALGEFLRLACAVERQDWLETRTMITELRESLDSISGLAG